MQEVGRKMIFAEYFFKKREIRCLSPIKKKKKKRKNDKRIFSLAWNIMFTDNYKILVLNFLGAKNVDRKIIFTDY